MGAQAEGGVRGGYHHRILLALLILSWAISWPVIKIGVATVPPIWYACFRYAIAASCLFAFIAVRHEVAFPPRTDWPLVAVSGVLQMAAYSALTALALTILPPGRASVLAFSTPIWVVPLAAWRLHERASRAALFGVGLGLLGALAIAAPSVPCRSERSRSSRTRCSWLQPPAWAVSIVIVRAHRFTASTLALAPWQMAFAACLLLPLAVFVEGARSRLRPMARYRSSMVALIATAFAYWAVVEVGRHIRASTMSMALLATPSLGILISALTLGEALGASLVAGVVLIGAGIRLATRASDR